MTDKNRIQRENAVAEALLGPGKTARNLMRLLITAHENGDGIHLEIWPKSGGLPITANVLMGEDPISQPATIDDIMEKAG